MSRPDVFLGTIDGGIPVVATDDGRGRALCVTEDKHWTMTREWENVEDKVRLIPEDHPLFGVRTPVHNHGTEEGPGLACREHTLTDGTLLGECMIPTLTENRDWWKERTVAAQDRALELAQERIEARPAVTREDVDEAVRGIVPVWDSEVEKIVAALHSLVSGSDPAVYVVRESDIAAVDVIRNKATGGLETRRLIFDADADPDGMRKALRNDLGWIAEREAIARAIEAEQAVDPVEKKAWELYRAVIPDARWETVADEYRRIARHILDGVEES